MLRELGKALIKTPVVVLEALLVLPMLAPSWARKARLAWRRATGKTSQAQNNTEA